MNKKGQMIIFVIIAMAIVGGIILLFMFKSSTGTPKTSLNVDTSSIRNYVDSCLESASSKAVFEFGLTGGVKNPDKSIIFGEQTIPVYNSASDIPSLLDLTDNLREDILSNFLVCFESNPLEQVGFDVAFTGSPTIDLYIKDKKIDVKLNYILSITKAEYKSTISDFSASIPLNLGQIYQNSYDLVANVDSLEAGQEYDISSYCSQYNFNGLTNIYIDDYTSESGETYKIIRFIDYSPYFGDYLNSLKFTFALNNNALKGECK
ncbi:MAG: hypothetical protein Q8L29_01630 [archaeon]|nr:hypothetical protein [archaeon]